MFKEFQHSAQITTSFKHFKLMSWEKKPFLLLKKSEIRRERVGVISVENVFIFSCMEVYEFSFCFK